MASLSLLYLRLLCCQSGGSDNSKRQSRKVYSLRHCLLLLVGFLATSANAEVAKLEIVELQNRTAPGMISVISPLLSSGESASGAGNQLFLKLLPENRDTVLGLVKKLDVSPKNLLVTVRQGGNLNQQQRSIGASGRIPAGDGSIQIGNDRRPANLSIIDSNRNIQNQSLQQIRVLEGYAATIFLGQELPLTTGVIRDANGNIIASSTGTRQVTTGFQVLPRLIEGDRVELEISPRNEQLNQQGNVEFTRSTTRVVGQLGEWIDIGSAINQLTQQTQGLLNTGKRSSHRQNDVSVKVEPQP